MNNSCLLCGVGGQGTVLASKLIAFAAMEKGLNVRTAETIGMAQRGGCVVSHARMGLVPGHGGGGIVQHHQDHLRLVVHGVDHAENARGEEGRVANKREMYRVRLRPVEALGHGHIGAHAQAGVHHVQRHGVAQGVAADVAAEDRLLPPAGLLDRVERGAVGTAGAQHRRPRRQCWRLGHGML